VKKQVPIAASLRTGFNLTLGGLGTCIAIILAFVSAFLLMRLLERLSVQMGPFAQVSLALPLYVLQMVVIAWLTSGWIVVALRGVRTGKLSIAGFLSGKPWVLKLMIATFLTQLLGMLAFVPGFIAVVVIVASVGPSASDVQTISSGMDLLFFVNQHAVFLIAVLATVGVGIIPPFLVGAYLGFAPCLIVDCNVGVMDSLRGSVTMAKGAILSLVNFSVAFALINLLGFLCLFVGLLITVPATMLAYSVVYDSLLRQTEIQYGGPPPIPGEES
jgi:hypothetical protein